jgi:transcriptional regulator with XRE-family HTH domain
MTIIRSCKKPWIDVKALRVERGWLQRDTAERLGITRSHLSNIEHKRRSISTELMIAIILEFDIAWEDSHDDGSMSQRS